MEYTVEHLDTPHVVLATMRGDFDVAGCLLVAVESRTAAAQHGCNVVYDLRQANLTLSVSEIYEWPRRIEATGVGTPDRIALLSNGHTPSVTFVETAARNAGHHVRLFTDRAAALDWATGKES